MTKLITTADLHQHPRKWELLVQAVADPAQYCGESPHRPGGQWMAVVGRTTWLQPGQVYDRLHYVTLDIADGPVVTDVCHSIFGPAPSNMRAHRRSED